MSAASPLAVPLITCAILLTIALTHATAHATAHAAARATLPLSVTAEQDPFVKKGEERAARPRAPKARGGRKRTRPKTP